MITSKKLLTATGIGLVLLCSALVIWSSRCKPPLSPDRDLEEKIKLIRGLLEKRATFFLSPSFLKLPLEKVQGFTRLAESRGRNEKALNDPSMFQAFHRENHFSAVLLSPTDATSPLCAALLSSPVWELTEASPSGYLFQPVGGGSWRIPSEEEILRNHPDPTERAQWLIGTAGNLIAIKYTRDADELLKLASKTNKLPSPLLATQASLAAARGRWNDALSLSRQALTKNSSNIGAKIIHVRALIECGKADEAFSEAKKLRTLTLSRNTEALFLLARAANAANDKNEEILALRDLITLAREHHQPLGASLTYLGQAYAQNGERGMAMRTFDEALAAPELTEDQRAMIRELIAHLKPETSGQPVH